MNSTSVIFLDRDGIINKNRDDYVKSIDEFIFLPNVIQAINSLRKLGFKIIVITNQSVINRGIISIKQLDEIHSYMITELNKSGCIIDKIYYCPHRPDENCFCRKPKPGLLKKAIKEFNVNISKSWFIGDSESDILAAKKVGLNYILQPRNDDLMKTVHTIKNTIQCK